MEHPRIYLVEDDEALCTSLRQLLTASGYQVTSFSSASETIKRLQSDEVTGEWKNTVALVDLHLKGDKGFEVQQAARDLALPMPFVFMSAHLDAKAVSQAWRGGAIDFLFKPFTPDELLETLAKALQSLASSAPASASANDPEVARKFRLLTSRQKEVLQRVAAGKSNTHIAAELNISPRTVKMHREAIMHRFGFQHLADLVRFHDACRELLGSSSGEEAVGNGASEPS